MTDLLWELEHCHIRVLTINLYWTSLLIIGELWGREVDWGLSFDRLLAIADCLFNAYTSIYGLYTFYNLFNFFLFNKSHVLMWDSIKIVIYNDLHLAYKVFCIYLNKKMASVLLHSDKKLNYISPVNPNGPDVNLKGCFCNWTQIWIASLSLAHVHTHTCTHVKIHLQTHMNKCMCMSVQEGVLLSG